MARPAQWKRMVRASKNEALLAVKLYNEPLLERSLEGFGVHMHLAWLYLLQAKFLKEGVEIRYPDRNFRGRFERVDGEHRTWELERCVQERWSDVNDPVRANLEFFIRFRNKTEHRYKGEDAALLAAIADKSQALLLNFEEELTSEFGKENTLASQLRFPVFIGTFTEPAELAMRRLRKSLSKDMQKFIAEYDTGLDESVTQDSRYAFRLKVQLQPSQRGKPDLAIEFVRADELTPEELGKLSDTGKTGTMVIKERSIGVSNLGLFKFSTVLQAVQDRIPFHFNQAHLLAALRIEGIRPASNNPRPERTRSEFCRYDSLNNNYGYTQAYVDHLVKLCGTADGFLKVTGRTARKKDQPTVAIERNDPNDN